MNIVLFQSVVHCFPYLSSIHNELKLNKYNSFFLHTFSRVVAYPNIDMLKFYVDYDGDTQEPGVISDSLNINLPFIPDYLILARERWGPEQSIIKEFREKFNCKIVLVEVNSQYYNVIESRLEMISRTKYPQNQVDILLDHSEFILNTRKQSIDWEKWDNSFVVGNPCYDNFSRDVQPDIFTKYNVDKNKKKILFFSLINMDRNICIDLLKNLVEKCGEEYQIFYKPFPGEPYGSRWANDYNPKFLVDNVQVIYDHLDVFSMYNLCDIHIGAISTVMYPSLMLGKKVVNINNFCKYLQTGNNTEKYENEDRIGEGDGSAKFWMEVHNLNSIEEFINLVDLDRVELFKQKNDYVRKIISECTYDYDYNLEFLNDNTKKDYTKLLKIFDEYNDGKASERIVDMLEKFLSSKGNCSLLDKLIQ